jgi:hypothetical protein
MASSTSPPHMSAGGLGIFLGSTGGGFSVNLVDTSGHLVATAPFARRTVIRVGGPGDNGPEIRMPAVSASRTRVYYLDGDSTVRFLTPMGERGVVGPIPGSQTAEAGFAVSPDDLRMAISVIDYHANPLINYAGNPPRLHLYVQDLLGANRKEIFTSTADYVWPVGWRQENLVLAAGPYAAQDGAENPYDAIAGYHLVDATTAGRLSTLCGPPNYAAGFLQPSGGICRDRNQVVSSSLVWLESWDGAQRSIDDACREVAPHGADVACGGGVRSTVTGTIYFLKRDGSRRQTSMQGWGPLGWIDDDHLVFSTTDHETGIRILDVGSGAVAEVPPTFFEYAGSLPGGLD